jgi:hypothetical protein
MLKFFKSFFKKADEPAVPYKVETPVAPVVVAEPPAPGAGQVDVPAEKPAKKTPAAKKAPAVKKPRATKKPKAE